VKSGDTFDLKFEGQSFYALLAAGVVQKKEPAPRNSIPRAQLRRSLPSSLPADIPTVNFKRKVTNTDLLGISSNPFDCLEEVEQSRMSKTSNAFQDKNAVPWPNDKPISLSMKKLF
jgi:hypothetical protein